MNSSRIEPVVIACAADGRYVMPLAVMIKSVLSNLHHDRKIWLYIMDGGINKNDKERLINSWDTDRLRADWMRVDQSWFANMPLWGRMTVSTYHRLLMPEFLPKSLHKAIWLDCDMIVKGNLADLWDMDLKDHAALAVQDMVVPYVSSRYGIAPYQELGILRNAKYFNAGVMVVNLDWWRQNDVAGRAFVYLRKYGKTVYFWDQEALNAALAGNWAELDPRWNQIASVSGRSFFSAAHLDSITYRQVVSDPLVMHFAGSFKPWTYYNRSPSRSLYFHYLDMTVWAGWRPPRTFGAILLGIYESLLRDFLYPVEKWVIRILRNRTLRKFRPMTGPRCQ
jgi:lipopolysaccharide biosynthesis glycosyltransferase